MIFTNVNCIYFYNILYFVIIIFIFFNLIVLLQGNPSSDNEVILIIVDKMKNYIKNDAGIIQKLFLSSSHDISCTDR